MTLAVMLAGPAAKAGPARRSRQAIEANASFMRSSPGQRVPAVPSRREPIARQVEEQRRREAHRIHAVEDSSMARDRAAPILHSEVALDGREDQPAENAGDDDEKAHSRRLQ